MNVKLKLVCRGELRWGHIQTDQVLLLQTKMHQQNTDFMRLILMEIILSKKDFVKICFHFGMKEAFL